MTPSDLETVAAIVLKRSGLVLTPDKGYLLENRLAPLARREGFASLDGLLAALKGGADDRLAWLVTEALTTNETSFYRDRTPFDAFEQEILPRTLSTKKSGDTLRIWSAACSSGQEAYSLAMLLDQNRAKLGGLKPKILATDISNAVLEKAKSGLFSQFEVQRGLPVRTLVEYFEKVDNMWKVSQKISSMIEFRRHNLLDPLEILGKFDAIFCRNVLIYFDQDTKRDVLNRISRQCTSDGFLVLGAAETVLGITTAFESVPSFRGLYTNAGAAAAAA